MDNTYQPIVGYKGLTQDMTSGKVGFNAETFEIGKVYYKDNKDKPSLCSSDGYHYCENLVDCFQFYRNNGKNRFFKIEILGNYTTGSGSDKKSITTAFRLVSEVSKEEIEKMVLAKKKKDLDERFRLEEVRFLQTQNPYAHVGGSVALYLHGLSLKRWSKNTSSDIDIVCPFFFQWSSTDEMDIEYKDAKASGNDFDETFILNDVKVDVKIDNLQRYEVVNYEGFDYKVSNVETILEAKIKYSLNGQQKHKEDIRELIGLKNN